MHNNKLNKFVLAMALTMFAGSSLANGLPVNGVFKGSGQSKLSIKGKLKKTNSCVVSLDQGGLFDIGTIEIKDNLDANGGVFAEKDFVANVKCEYPSAVVLSWGSSRTDLVSNPKNFSKTSSPAGNLVYNTRIILKKGSTVTSPTQTSALNVGTMTGAAAATALVSSVAALDSHTGGSNTHLSSNPAHKKMVTFRDGLDFSMHEEYSLPFSVKLKSKPFSGWINDMPSGKLNLNEQITIKSYII